MGTAVCIIGKIQQARSDMCQITDIEMENNVCDLVVETTQEERGKIGWQYLVPTKQVYGMVTTYQCRVTGHSHMLHLLGNFNLINLEVTIVANGKR